MNTPEQHYTRINIKIAAAKGGQTIQSVFKEKANQIPTRKSLSNDEINLLEESFPELVVAKELIPIKRKSKTQLLQGSTIKERKTGTV